MSATSASTRYQADMPRVSFIVPGTLAAFVLLVSLTLLVAGAAGPYTHSNLDRAYDSSYTRTEQIVVGSPVPYSGIGGDVTAGDPVKAGERLFVTAGCVACHGLGGHGGIVGPAITHNDVPTLTQRIRTGAGGMPRFSGAITDEDIADISAYLRSVAEPGEK